MNRRAITNTIRTDPWFYIMWVYENGKHVETSTYGPYMFMWDSYR